MGRRYYNSKATVEESLDVSIFYLKRRGMLTGDGYRTLRWVSSQTGKRSGVGIAVHTTDDPHVRFLYTRTNKDGQKTEYDQRVSLTTTPCRFGGLR